MQSNARFYAPSTAYAELDFTPAYTYDNTTNSGLDEFYYQEAPHAQPSYPPQPSSRSSHNTSFQMNNFLADSTPQHDASQFAFSMPPSQLSSYSAAPHNYLPAPSTILASTYLHNNNARLYTNAPQYDLGASIMDAPHFPPSVPSLPSLSPPRLPSGSSTIPASPAGSPSEVGGTSLASNVPQTSAGETTGAQPLPTTGGAKWPRFPSNLLTASTASLPMALFQAGTGALSAPVRLGSQMGSKPAKKSTSSSVSQAEVLLALAKEDKVIPEFKSIKDARAWREKVRETVLDRSVPLSFLDEPQDHVQRIIAAMLSLTEAVDKGREINGAKKRQSPAYKMIANGAFDQVVVITTAWLVFENLLQLHQVGCHLRRDQLPPLVRPECDELSLSAEERLEAVIDLLKKEKMAVKDLLEGGDREAMRTVRAPRSILELKASTRKLNDSRGVGKRSAGAMAAGTGEAVSGIGEAEEAGGEGVSRPAKRARKE